MSTLGALADAESRMLAVLDELGLTGLVTTIPGLSAVGAAVIYGSRGRGCPGVTAQVTATPPAMRPTQRAVAITDDRLTARRPMSDDPRCGPCGPDSPGRW